MSTSSFGVQRRAVEPTGSEDGRKCVVCRDYEANIRGWIEQLGGDTETKYLSLELERLIDKIAPPEPKCGSEDGREERRGDGWLARTYCSRCKLNRGNFARACHECGTVLIAPPLHQAKPTEETV